MEFKDKLRQARRERGLSQQALADAIFVSRSAVAKWENGLGYPAAESLAALTGFFAVEEGYFTTQEPETVIVKKNRHIRRLDRGMTALIVLMILTLLVGFFHSQGGIELTLRVLRGPLETFALEQLEDPTGGNWSVLFRVDAFPDTGAVFFSRTFTLRYCGFFYSADGEPVGYWGTEMEFYHCGRDDWYWAEETGDNWMHVEHIVGNWYWFDMHF